MLHLYNCNAKERNLFQLDVCVIGIEYWYSTFKEYWYCRNNVLLNTNQERPSSLKAKEGSLLLGTLTICLKALTVKTYHAV